jgi:hypothetical protein
MAIAKHRLISLIQSLLHEGEAISNGIPSQTFDVFTRDAAKFEAGCRNLVRILGVSGEHWANDLTAGKGVVDLTDVERVLGTLLAVREAIDQDLLIRIEDLIVAETFADLLEQADYLLSENYFLAAGVLGRAVLEEHLRKWCDRSAIKPTKPRPTLSDSKIELYKAHAITKVEMMHVDAMAAVGNDAAHNQPSLKREAVERMLRDVRDFVAQHPLS